MRVSLNKVNLPRALAVHVVGKNHSEKHHLMFGFLFMVAGVLIGKAGGLYDFLLFHLLAEAVGAAVHGVGLIPYLDYLLKVTEGGE
jgi:cyanate permease